MRIAPTRLSILLVLLVASGACSTLRGPELYLARAISVCQDIKNPKLQAPEELWYALREERAYNSKRLWNRAGLSLIETKLRGSNDPVERSCLDELGQEARTKTLLTIP